MQYSSRSKRSARRVWPLVFSIAWKSLLSLKAPSSGRLLCPQRSQAPLSHPCPERLSGGQTREVQRETLDWEEEMERLGLCAQLCHHLGI